MEEHHLRGLFEDRANFSNHPYFKLLPQSTPYCTFRNVEGYASLGDEKPAQSKQVRNLFRMSNPDNQVRLYLNSLGDHNVPPNLLYGTMRRDSIALTSAKESSFRKRSTVARLTHHNQSLCAYVSGSHLDHVVLQDSRDITSNIMDAMIANLRGRRFPRSNSFSIALTNGAPIEQIVTAGASCFGRSSHILATTNAEVYHLQTVDVDDHIPLLSKACTHSKGKQFSKNSCEPTTLHGNGARSGHAKYSTILEPVQKYQLPSQLVGIASSSTNYQYSYMLTKNWNLFSWNPIDGIVSVYSSVRWIPRKICSALGSNNTSTPTIVTESDIQLECSLHPQIQYLGAQNSLSLLDLRCAGPAVEQYHFGANITSIKQHGTIGYQYMLAGQDKVTKLMDSRYTKTYVAKRVQPSETNILKYYDGAPYGAEGNWMEKVV